MTAVEAKPTALPAANSALIRLAKVFVSLAVPLVVWAAPLSASPNAKLALAISAFMIIAWMTEAMEYAAAGLLGLLMFWLFEVSTPQVIFSGFGNEAAWFTLGAMLIGAMATKSGLPQRIGNYVVSNIGVTYSRLLLGLIIVDFLLTFVVPSGAAIVVVMASIAIGVINLFGVQKGSNIARGLFLVITYTTSIFNKMVIAGTASIIARGLIETHGGVTISWGLWFAAFLPCALVTIFASWWLTLKLFPPEVESLKGREAELKAHFQTSVAWTPLAVRSALLSVLALALWTTDWLHGVSPGIVAFAIGLIALAPFVGVLNEEDFRRINLLPFFFIAAAIGMSEVLRATGGLEILTGSFIGWVEPLLTNKIDSIVALYWGGFVYHFMTASEISMLVTSLPILMEYAKTNNIDPVWIGMIWSFSSGGKLFAYESAVLVLGYAYGYFRHTDLIRMGALLTLIEFVVLALSVIFYWPLLGIG